MGYYAKKPYSPPDGTKKKKWNGYKPGPQIIKGSKYKPLLNPSEEQRAIIDDMKNNPGSLVVDSKAGCGKTSTAVEGMYGLPRSTPICYAIFAKRNQIECAERAPAHVETTTTHSLGLRALKATYGSIDVDAKGEKDAAIGAALLGPEDEKIELRYHFGRAMSMCKSNLCTTVQEVQDVCDRHAIDMCDMDREEFCSNVIKGMDLALIQYNRVNFDDMIFVALRKNIRLNQFPQVIADEAQDLSPSRIELILRSIAPGGRLTAIGDTRQNIFSFAGSLDNAMESITERTNARTLPLFTTFRCGKKIVELAQTIVPEYRAYEGNQDGEVVERSFGEMMAEVEKGGAAPGDFILSRVNAPLVPICLQLVKEGRKASVAGKNLGKSLAYMVRRSEALSVANFLCWLDEWEGCEKEKLIARNKSCDHITDKADCLRALCDGTNMLDVVKARIAAMFGDEEKDTKEDRVWLSSTHKAKGLEAPKVFVLSDTFRPGKSEEEDNLCYVAWTRAISSLNLVSGSLVRE